jgi:hypothetical protein
MNAILLSSAAGEVVAIANARHSSHTHLLTPKRASFDFDTIFVIYIFTSWSVLISGNCFPLKILNLVESIGRGSRLSNARKTFHRIHESGFRSVLSHRSRLLVLFQKKRAAKLVHETRSKCPFYEYVLLKFSTLARCVQNRYCIASSGFLMVFFGIL